MSVRSVAKKILGEMPLTAEGYWHLRQGGKPPRTGFKLEKLQARLPKLTLQASEAARLADPGKKVLIFCTLHFWISHGAILGLALAGNGHTVTLAFMPYGNSDESINKFDLRRQNIYASKVLQTASPLVNHVSFLKQDSSGMKLPSELGAAVDGVSLRDTQYIRQVEDIDLDDPLFLLRKERNRTAASGMMNWIKSDRPDVVILPNGSILEFGSVFQVCRYLSVQVTTYEFGEQRNCLWLAQNEEVMRQQTKDLWVARGGQTLSDDELDKIRTLFSSRQNANLWGNFSRRWQGVPSAGEDEVRKSLGLDDRPLVLLATNVIGDSLTLGRQVFSDSMTEWLNKSLMFFAEHPEVQLVVRIHPGELITKGPSVAEVIQKEFQAGLPDHIYLIPADAEVNTYDLVNLADLGLVYTTTVGLEMAMSGVPVMVIGQTHYREKGFTLDPESWESYFDSLAKILKKPHDYRLNRNQVDKAWQYAYRFFFEYPHPFPWHLLYLWEDLDRWPIEKALSAEGLAQYQDTFRYLVGEPISWSN